MTEPSSNIPDDIANAEVEAEEPTTPEQPRVGLNVDQEKREAWDRIKSDYETEPDGQPVPNSMDQAQTHVAEAEETDEDRDDEGHADEDRAGLRGAEEQSADEQSADEQSADEQ